MRIWLGTIDGEFFIGSKEAFKDQLGDWESVYWSGSETLDTADEYDSEYSYEELCELLNTNKEVYLLVDREEEAIHIVSFEEGVKRLGFDPYSEEGEEQYNECPNSLVPLAEVKELVAKPETKVKSEKKEPYLLDLCFADLPFGADGFNTGW